jgi:Tfp pilus assembly protein FimT
MQAKQAVKGQTLVEFLIVAGITALFLCGGMTIFMQAWNRSRCIHVAFLKTHAALTGQKFISSRVQISEDSKWIYGEAICAMGSHKEIREKIQLPKLEGFE